MIINLIVACTPEGGIGLYGDIPWHIKEDMKHFKKTTEGSCVIMGRKTWDSIPERFRPLPGRLNIVLSRSPSQELIAQESDNMVIAQTLEMAMEIAEGRDYGDVLAPVFIMGGAEIYREALTKYKINKAYITMVMANFTCSKFIDLKKIFNRNNFVRAEAPKYDEKMCVSYQFMEIEFCKFLEFHKTGWAAPSSNTEAEGNKGESETNDNDTKQ